MKWIFITLAGGALIFMAYSTYSSINIQLQSSAINKTPTPTKPKTGTSIEKVEKTITNRRQTPPK